jgi:putative methyltransferase
MMAIKRNVYLAQWLPKTPSMPYVYLPYSVGCIWAYADTQKEITDNYQLKDIFFLTKDPIDVINDMDNPYVFGISCYVWNWNYNLEVIRLLKQKYPQCYVIAGGPHIPNDDPYFFRKYPNIDATIHQEGELAFTDLLKCQIGLMSIDDTHGISYPSESNDVIRMSGSNRIPDLSVLPSPYLSGLFDGMMAMYKDDPDIIINGIIETNRGCPYRCTFCDWGGITYNKLKKINLERVFAEIDWFSENEFDLVLGVDANFGILYDRDMEIAEYLVKKRNENGYPNYFDTSWAKNNSTKTLSIAKVLADGNMLKSFMISIQTTNETTLSAIERKSMEVSDFNNLNTRAKKLNVPIATEIILGLPCETYLSWKIGLVDLLLHDVNVSINPLVLLPNAEMFEDEYRKRYGIETANINSWTNHNIKEYNETVIGTNSMSVIELKRTWAFTWFIIGLELHGFTKFIAKYLNKQWGISHSRFYDEIINLSKSEESVLHKHYQRLQEHTNNHNFHLLVSFSGYKDLVKDVGVSHRNDFYHEMKSFIKFLVPSMPTDEISGLVKFQEMSLLRFNEEYPISGDFNYNFKEFLTDDETHISKTHHYKFTGNEQTDTQSIIKWSEYIIGTRLIRGWENNIE